MVTVGPYVIFSSDLAFETLRLVTGGVILPATAIVGTTTNLITIVVLISEGLSHANNVSLFNLAIIDFLLCSVSTVTYSDYFFGVFDSDKSRAFKLAQYNFLWRTVYMLYQANMYVVMKIIVERFIAIRFPFVSRNFMTFRKSLLANVAVWAVVLGTHLWAYPDHGRLVTLNYTVTDNCSTSGRADNFHLGHTVSPNSDSLSAPTSVNASHVDIFRDNSSDLTQNTYFLYSLTGATNIGALFLYFIQPCRFVTLTVVGVCNIWLVLELRKHGRRRRHLTVHEDTNYHPPTKHSLPSTSPTAGTAEVNVSKTGHTQHSTSFQFSKSERQMARVTVGLGVLFLLSFTGNFLTIARTTICNGPSMYCSAINYSPITSHYYSLTQTVGVVYTLGSSVNFFLYCALNKRFRDKFLRIFCRSHKKV